MTELTDFIVGISGMAFTLAVMLYAFASRAERQATKWWFVLAIVCAILGSRKVVVVPSDATAAVLRTASLVAAVVFFYSIWRFRKANFLASKRSDRPKEHKVL